MATNGPNKKILIVADLDYTHFNHSKSDVEWIGNPTFWVTLYSDISKMASEKNIDMVFGIVTNKPIFDDISATAANTFYPFLKKHNPHMFVTRQNETWCLASINGKLQYECLANNKMDAKEIPADAFSHFIIMQGDKSAPIRHLASLHGIPVEHCILLDDTPSVLESAKSNNIQTISFECFHPFSVNIKCLDDIHYVERNLNEKKTALLKTVNALFSTMETPSLPMPDDTEHSVVTLPSPTSDPKSPSPTPQFDAYKNQQKQTALLPKSNDPHCTSVEVSKTNDMTQSHSIKMR